MRWSSREGRTLEAYLKENKTVETNLEPRDGHDDDDDNWPYIYSHRQENDDGDEKGDRKSVV